MLDACAQEMHEKLTQLSRSYVALAVPPDDIRANVECIRSFETDIILCPCISTRNAMYCLSAITSDAIVLLTAVRTKED